MVELAGSILLAILALTWVAVRVKTLSRSVEKSVERTRRDFESAGSAGEVRIPVQSSYPLSHEMIKEVARAQGWRAIGGGSSKGVSKVRFIRDNHGGARGQSDE